MLQGAAAALAEMFAGRFDARGRRFQNFQEVGFAFSVGADADALTGEREGDENLRAVEVGYAVAEVAQRVDGDVDFVGEKGIHSSLLYGGRPSPNPLPEGEG